MKKRILLAPDKFKGSLSAVEICNILKREIDHNLPNTHIEVCPLADGGDGSLEILTNYLDLEKRCCASTDPLGRPIEVFFYVFGNTAYIELASASGLVLLEEFERNPMWTSTYGTGLQIKEAVKLGIENIILFLGGSATHDGGMGIASALGFTFVDDQGNELKPVGASLRSVNKIIPPMNQPVIHSLTLCCDVNSIPFGEKGAAFVYAEQKGADWEEIITLDRGLQNLCAQVNRHNGIDTSNLKGGGAAGGVAISLVGLLKGEIKSGIDFFTSITELDSKIANADVVISGEGRLDNQSLDGKVVSGVADICRKYGKKIWLVVGQNDLSKLELEAIGIERVFSVMDYAEDIDDAILNGRKYVEEIGLNLMKSLIQE